MSDKEYEIKLLGEPNALQTIFRDFMKVPSLRDRNYAFNTYYLDHYDRFYFSGFSLRYRTGVKEIGKGAGVELKALAGEIGNVSSRLEIGIRNECMMKAAFNLMARSDYPTDAPRLCPGQLSVDFATSVRRVERRAVVALNGREYIIEAALDDIAYLSNEGKSGDGVFDCVLMPVKVEHELEFEIKDADDSVMPVFYEWVRNNCIRHTPIELTTRSKALRGRACC